MGVLCRFTPFGTYKGCPGYTENPQDTINCPLFQMVKDGSAVVILPSGRNKWTMEVGPTGKITISINP